MIGYFKQALLAGFVGLMVVSGAQAAQEPQQQSRNERLISGATGLVCAGLAVVGSVVCCESVQMALGAAGNVGWARDQALKAASRSGKDHYYRAANDSTKDVYRFAGIALASGPIAAICFKGIFR